MATEPKLNKTKSTGHLAVAEAQALECWEDLERHIRSKNLYREQQRCGCYRHDLAGHIVIYKNCEVGEACAEQYEVASRRVREMTVTYEIIGLEHGDMESTVEVVRA